MNLPNKITTFRVILIPFFVFFMLSYTVPHTRLIALVIFVAASCSDFLDGYLARKYHLVTNFGKFMDPLADKLLVCAALICFVSSGQLSAWVGILIISREFIVTGFRLIAAEQGVVIAASYWGKFKTTAQMIMSILLIIDRDAAWFVWLSRFFIWAAVILTVISMVDYIYKNIDVLKEKEGKEADER